MKSNTVLPLLPVITIWLLFSNCQSSVTTCDSESPNCVRDILWVWGNPEMAEPGQHTAASFAQAGPAERATILGVPNIIMAGLGLPHDDREAERLTGEVAHCPRLIWEVSTDSGESQLPFVYEETIGRVRRIAGQYPQIEGILLDDMSSVGIDHGFKPEHIREVRRLLGPDHSQLKIWGVLYTMNFNREGIDKYIQELDVISLWTWHAKDVADLEKNVAHCERLYPDKPIVLGLYMYDYGDGRRMPMELLEQQCRTALELAEQGRVRGIVFLTINNDADAISWVADWIASVGDQPLGGSDRSR